MTTTAKQLVIGIVGVCGSGKTTVVHGLLAHGITARPIAQEHSYVPTMWRRITNPDILIFLDASYHETIRRRQLNWTEAEYEEQHRRLADARQHANLYIFTDPMTPEGVIDQVYRYLQKFLAPGEE